MDTAICPVKDLSTLEDAVAFSAWAHRGQRDKSGTTYILHPLRVMLSMKTDEERIAAVLHDVLEDTDWTATDLLNLGCSSAVVEAVEYLTRQNGESYEDFIERVNKHPLARKVKRADLEDNMNIHRLQALTDGDLQRLRKYHHAWKRLQLLPDAI